MDYLYENIGEDRFQELCQSLLIKEFPNVQCFPVRQPDGGRDAISFFSVSTAQRGEQSFIVFQVKYVRKPLAEKEPHAWLVSVLKDELPKLESLIPKGARAYYLLTNVPGTSHLESGSIDKANRILSETLAPNGVESYVWWRDDLNRRMDNAYDIKWRYPDLMGGTDMLRAIIEKGLSEDRERRSSALRAFLRKQYDDDEDVRFKQIELQNRLLDLFVDVPLAVQSTSSGNPAEAKRSAIIKNISHVCDLEPPVGAATALLNRNVQRMLPHLVLEGAPGQGKSTLAQYICQVHRMRLLELHESLAKLPPEHQTDSVRIPFRVDLRDLATWFSKQDPFTPEEKKTLPDQWAPSLEAFLAAQIHFHSGGVAFSVSDLHAVLKISSVLLVLDGLDEVADLSERQQVVRQIMSGVNRLREIASSIQVVITSRPTAFTSSVGFPDTDYPHLQLDSLTKALIVAYAEKWIRTQRLSARDASNVIKIMNQKIEQPHLKDLGRNPMQLSILLSLIHTLGPSLPDKRTALYDGYVSLFFKREAEKDSVVRDNREILVDLHRYLGWFLHSHSEMEASKSRIGYEDLQKLLRDYLISEERTPEAVTELFTAMRDRIIFIVSRVQGTFEFEVQPLREYFAARHLYVTAPYAPSGSSKKGSLPDRFDGIAANPYWLNVTRFFSGCFDKGELPCLIDRLKLLSEQEHSLTNQPQRLAATLLGDWVFTEDQRSTRAAVNFVLDLIGVRHPLGGARGWHRVMHLAVPLPSKCGREEVLAKCLTIINSQTKPDVATEMVNLLIANATTEELDDFWRNQMKISQENDLPTWVQLGGDLGTLERSDVKFIDSCLENKSFTPKLAGAFLTADRADIILSSEDRVSRAIDAILGGVIRARYHLTDPLNTFGREIDPFRYSLAFELPQPRPLRDHVRTYLHMPESSPYTPSSNVSTAALEKCFEFLRIAKEQNARLATEWASDLGPWTIIVEKSRSLWGEQMVNLNLANLAAGIRSKEFTCGEYPNLLDHDRPLCERVRYARLRSGNSKWWRSQVESVKTVFDKLLIALTLLFWGSIKTIATISNECGGLLDSLSNDEWDSLRTRLESSYFRSGSRNLSSDLSELPDEMSDRLVVGLGVALGSKDATKLYEAYLDSYSLDDLGVLVFCAENALQLSQVQPSAWTHALFTTQKLYRKGVVTDVNVIDRFYQYGGTMEERLPTTVAKKILTNPKNYPRNFVFAAAQRYEIEIEHKLKSVRDIAINEKWFDR